MIMYSLPPVMGSCEHPVQKTASAQPGEVKETPKSKSKRPFFLTISDFKKTNFDFRKQDRIFKKQTPFSKNQTPILLSQTAIALKVALYLDQTTQK